MYSLSQLKQAPITLMISVAALLAFVFTAFADRIAFEFSDFNFCEFSWHRLLACHLLHWSGEHLFWDLSVFGLLGILCECGMPRRFAVTTLLSAVLIPLIVYFARPEVGSYRGLSGLDTALFTLVVSRFWFEKLDQRSTSGIWLFGLLLVAMICKLSLEAWSQENVFVSDRSFTPVPMAHVVGAAIGFIVSTCGFTRDRPS